MSQNALAVVLALISGFAGGGVTWLVARRKTSGSIETSEAKDLWAEGKAIRLELAAQVQLLRNDITTCDSEAARLREEIAALHAEIVELRTQNTLLLEEIALLKRRPPRVKR